MNNISRLFSMAAVALAMGACSSSDDITSQPETTAQQPGTLKFNATVAAPGNGTGTRTVYTEVTEGDDAGKINVVWKEGDEICIIDSEFENNMGSVTVGTPAADGSAPVNGTITATEAQTIKAVYPAELMTNTSQLDTKIFSQSGTLAYIQDNLDFRIGEGTLSVSGDEATLTDNLQMESGIAIWKLTLQNSSSEPLAATQVIIWASNDAVAATATISATSTVYLAVLTDPIIGLSIGENADITIDATVGSDYYTYSASGVTLASGKYYQSTVKMEKVEY